MPKAIGFFLVQGIQEKLHYDLYDAVNKDESMASSLGEPPEITAERTTLKQSIDTMRKSLKVLQRDPDITATLSYDDELSRDIKQSLEHAKRAEEFKKQGGQRQPGAPGQGAPGQGAPGAPQ